MIEILPNSGQNILLLLCLSVFFVTACHRSEDRSETLSNAEKIIRERDVSAGVSALQKVSRDVPIYQYYQKVPRMTGVTNDPENVIFNLQVELGYEVGDVRTLEKLSRFGIKIAGEIRQSIAAKTKIYLGELDNYSEIEKDILKLVNKIIAPNPEDKARIKDVIISELLLYDYR